MTCEEVFDQKLNLLTMPNSFMSSTQFLVKNIFFSGIQEEDQETEESKKRKEEKVEKEIEVETR